MYLLLLFAINIIGVARFKNLTKSFRILVVLTIAIFVSELCSRMLIREIKNSIPTVYFSAFAEFILYTAVYYCLYQSKAKRVLLYLAVLGTLAFAVQLFLTGLLAYPTVFMEFTHIIFLIYTLLYYRQMLSAPTQVALTKQSDFWFNTALFVFSSIGTLNFGLHTYAINHKPGIDVDNIIFPINILLYATIGWAVIIDKRNVYE